MALRPEYAMHHSGLEDFLFSTAWTEGNGSVLSVLSAFGRLGLDPWEEAGRLADMPRASAVTILAAILTRLPRDVREVPDCVLVARRLVQTLPERRRHERAPGRPPSRHIVRFDAVPASPIFMLILSLAAVAVILRAIQWLWN
jgi:hypothetical protein